LSGEGKAKALRLRTRAIRLGGGKTGRRTKIRGGGLSRNTRDQRLAGGS